MLRDCNRQKAVGTCEPLATLADLQLAEQRSQARILHGVVCPDL